ncbi:MAG TPA: hypothetical protein VN618_06995 [Solirubrobacteraceae bacterium]|nr:hypothetical protein [Solirubrobacteraceae bacterium]
MEDDRRLRGTAGDSRSERLALAAVRRAALHDGRERGAAPLRAVRAHLSVAPRTTRARELTAQLERLREAGLLETTRAHGVVAWGLSADGSRLLAQAEAEGWRAELPESPQHRAWRVARATAEQELGRFALGLREDLREAAALLDALSAGAGRAPHSDAWLALGPRLLADCRRLGSAWHCLHEWPEPGEESADRDPSATDPLRAGRRNIALWARGA